MPENGVLQIYTANETEAQNVWFDDLKVTFTPQLIVQENHYYPFGLELSGLSKKGKPEHRWKFNGVENVQVFGLNWNETQFRTYDLQLGRWHQIDPKNSARESAYVGMGNRPVFFQDSAGDTVRIKHIVSSDHETSEFKEADGHLNPGGAIQLGIFVRTPEGRRIIGDYANAGDVIGGIEFKETGKFASHNLTIREFNDDSHGISLGVTDIRITKQVYRKGKKTITSKSKLNALIQINLAPQLEKGNMAGVSVTYGHEFFLHLDGKDDVFVKALEKGNNKEVQELYQEYRKNVRNDTDHKNYQKFGSSKFNSYVKNLEKILIYNIQDVRKAKDNHDKVQKSLYGKLRKK